MTRVAISIQTLSGHKDTYLRTEVGTMHKGTVLAAVEEMLAAPEAHDISKKTKKLWRHPAKRGEEDLKLKGGYRRSIINRATRPEVRRPPGLQTRRKFT